MRIRRGRTFNRRAQYSTRARMALGCTSSGRIGTPAQEDGKDGFHDTAPFAAVQSQQRVIESRPQPPLLITVDGGVGEAGE